ncbi:hypothetical protein DPMN_026541 [Dreissena polymorpha]|uniref:Uncharacterized protein n=1 Tax=Dreissena polymorpha TaxID=45954 RepID=A0A9D4RCP5_DREPO|nr:hypothetical protein DPMN_026541 [Dreissena polymorpha]
MYTYTCLFPTDVLLVFVLHMLYVYVPHRKSRICVQLYKEVCDPSVKREILITYTVLPWPRTSDCRRLI